MQCFNPYKNQDRDFPADVQQPEVLAEVVAEWESGRLMPLGGAKTKRMAATSASGRCCHLPAAFRKGKAATARANSVLRDETNPAAPLHSCSSILEIKREFIYSETRAIASSCWNNYNDLRASPATPRKKQRGLPKLHLTISSFRANLLRCHPKAHPSRHDCRGTCRAASAVPSWRSWSVHLHSLRCVEQIRRA